MPAPHNPLLPGSLLSKHLYRHLLREASYLPPAIRPPLESQIRARFRAGRPNSELTKVRRKTGHRILRRLRAANSGDTSVMLDLIYKAFGRTGKRRRELVNQLVQRDAPADADALEDIINSTAGSQSDPAVSNKQEKTHRKDQEVAPIANPTIRKKNRFLLKWDLQKLNGFLKSQRTQYDKTVQRMSWPVNEIGALRDTNQAPDKNIWGKPVHPGRIETLRAAWWKKSVEKIMPPLDKESWELLSNLVAGSQEHDSKWKVPDARRAQANQMSDIDNSDCVPDWVVEAHATKTATRAEQGRTRSQKQRTGQEVTGPYDSNLKEKACSPRFFRRAYLKTHLLSSTLEHNPNTLETVVKWGTQGARIPTASARQMAIFDGLPDAEDISQGKRGRRKT